MEPTHNQESAPIVGAWRLISLEIQREDGEVMYPFGKKVQGSLIYTKSGRFSAQVMSPDRPQFASGDQMRGTAEEIKANYEGFVSYYGPYEFHKKEGFVIHHVEGSLFPNWEGRPQKRFYKLLGNRLKLSTPPTLWSGGEVVGVLLWERIE
jgi:hypothetical protein